MRTMQRTVLSSAAVAVALVVCAVVANNANGQAVTATNSGNANVREVPVPDVAGVWVDTEGVLRLREHDAAALAAERRRVQRLLQAGETSSDQLVYVSLPRLFAEVRRRVEAGEPLSDELRCLHGLVKLRYVFVYPDDNDLVIAGEAEPINAAGSYRPTGATTGRPVLQLDDLVTALRLMRPGRAAAPFGCTIDLPAGAQDAVRDTVYGSDRRTGDRAAVLDRLPDAVGPQLVKVFGIPADTRFAMVCLEADYIMKRQSIGVDPPHIPQVRYSTSGAFSYNRAWFKANYEPIGVDAVANAMSYEIRGQGVSLDTSGSEAGRAAAPANAVRYAEAFTKNFPTLARVVPAYADLANLADLALLASIIGHDRLDRRVGWDTSWLMRDGSGGYAVASVPTPRTAETIANFRSRTYVVGGVLIQLDSMFGAQTGGVLQREAGGDVAGGAADDGVRERLHHRRHRPASGAWFDVVKP